MLRFGSDLERRGIDDPRVLAAMNTVPRHHFVDGHYQSQAYGDYPLPIGRGQTISQPYIVALMTQLLQLDHHSRVLEIGTGSGYQTAILAEIAGEVYTIERIAGLYESARERLEALGYGAVHMKMGDGYMGWPDHAPYNAIIVTCAPDHVPTPLTDQLANGGRMVLPVGPVGGTQYLTVVVRNGEYLHHEQLHEVAFVPLVGGHDTIPY